MVESRNSFSMHITPPSLNALRMVASVYNRALRRRAGAPRYERVEHAPSDLDIRRKLRVPSYDCIMMRGRLRYVGRIIRTQPTALFAMLSVQCGGFCVALLASAPPPDLEAPFLIGVMRDRSRLAQVVKSVRFFMSALDD